MDFRACVVSERPTHDAEVSAPLQQQAVVERACSPQIPTESVMGLLTSNTVQSFQALPDHLHTEAVFLSLMKSHHIFLETEKVRVEREPERLREETEKIRVEIEPERLKAAADLVRAETERRAKPSTDNEQQPTSSSKKSPRSETEDEAWDFRTAPLVR